MISAIVFDFDGLILDTETPIFASWSRVFDEHASTPLTMDEWSSEIGTVGGVDLVALFQSRAVTDIDVDELQARRRAHRDELLAREVVRPGVEQWIADAQARRLPLAIASSSEVEWVDPHLGDGIWVLVRHDLRRVRVSRVPRSRARGET